MNKADEILSVAPVNIEALIEAAGLQLERKAQLHPSISGQIERLADGGYKISVNEKDNYFRRRFTMAHELAHFLAHRDLIGEGVDDTPAYRSTDLGQFHNKKIKATHEAEANRLAARLLMPEELVTKYFSELGQDIPNMAKKFQVSEQAMSYRLQALGLIGANDHRF